MCVKTIADRLKRDLTGRTAADVVAENPNDPDDPDCVVFADDADVPRFMYLSLKQLFDEHRNNDPEFVFADSVIPKKGFDSTLECGIELAEISCESVYGADGDKTDSLDAEYAYVSILFRINEIENDDLDTLENIWLRARYILDSRTQRQFRPILYPPTSWKQTKQLDPRGIDLSLDPDYEIECLWLKNPDVAKVNELVSIYRVQFRRRFGS